MLRQHIPFYLFLLNSIVLAIVFGEILLISLLKPNKHYETSSSYILLGVLVLAFIGLYFGVKFHERTNGVAQKRNFVSIVGNSIFTLLVFLLLLFGALIV